MKFRFNVCLTDEDYFAFNRFQTIESPLGKKQMLRIRLIVAVFSCICALATLWSGGFTTESFVGLIPFVLVAVIFIVTVPKTFTAFLKFQLKSMKKHGKPGYSPSSVVEFYDDCFAETTPENKTEQKYTAVENVFVVEGRVIYLFVNNIMAYIIPRSSFESVQQYNDFLNFIETKCEKVKYC